VLLLVGALVATSAYHAIAADCDSVVVDGAGITITNGTYAHIGSHNGKPEYGKGAGLFIRWNALSTSWQICSSTETYYIVQPSTADTPPDSGWTTGDDGDLPIPSVAGGYCAAGFGEWTYEATVGPTNARTGVSQSEQLGGVQEAISSAFMPFLFGIDVTHAFIVGETITGGCRMVTAGGGPINVGYLVVELYKYEPRSIGSGGFGSSVYDLRQQSHDIVRYNRVSRDYRFSFDTSDWAPGLYSLRIMYPDGAAETVNFALIPELAIGIQTGQGNINEGLQAILDAATEIGDSLIGAR